MGYYSTNRTLNYVVGLVNNNMQEWVAIFSVYKAEIISDPLYSNTSGWKDSGTLEGMIKLTAQRKYSFGASRGYTIIANSKGQTSSWIGTLFKIELLKTN